MKQLAPVIELASHETRQRRDPLTGLPDRRVLDHWPTPGMDVPPLRCAPSCGSTSMA